MIRSPSLALANRVVDMDGVKYRVFEQIDDGSFSDVYKVQRLTDNNFFALKKNRVLRGNQDATNHLKNECYAASKLGAHPHIVQLFEKNEHALQGGKQGDKEVFLLQELCPGGNLFNLIQSRTNQGQKGLQESEVLLIASHIIQGLLHMHIQQPPIAHRDIKPENILLGIDNKWKLCDFGSSTIITQTSITGDNRWAIEEEIKRQTTRLYQAPEQIDLYSGFPINEKVDIFALGCLMYTLLFFRSPFDPDMVLEHSNARYTLPPQSTISPGMRQLLAKTLAQDPRERISSSELWSQIDHMKQLGDQQSKNNMLSMTQTDQFGVALERKPQLTPTKNTNQLLEQQDIMNFVDPRIANTDRPRQERATRRCSSVANIRQSSTQQQVVPQVQQNYGAGGMLMMAQGGSNHNHAQSLIVPMHQQNMQQIQTPQVQMNPVNFINMAFPSAQEQSELNIRNWVNHYCEVSQRAPSELAFRNIINVLIPNQNLTRTFMIAISQQDTNMVIVALKSFCLIHRQMLYCPQIDPLPYERLFSREHQKWTQIKERGQGHPGDYFRTPLLINIVSLYLEILKDKIDLVKEFGNIVNSGYILQRHTIGANNLTTNSPIATQFHVKLTQLFDKFRNLHGLLFIERNQLFEVRLTLAVNLIEDQFQLMALITHLNFTFKVMYKLKQGANSSQNLTKVAGIINQFDSVFTRCLCNYDALLTDVRKINDLQHIRQALPEVKSSLPNTLMQLADREAQRLWNSPNAFAELLRVHNKLEGLYLPVLFELYPNYLTSCNHDHEVILGNPRYRATLDQKLPDDYFNNPRQITAAGKTGIQTNQSSQQTQQRPQSQQEQQNFQQPQALIMQQKIQQPQPVIQQQNPCVNQQQIVPSETQLLRLMDTAQAAQMQVPMVKASSVQQPVYSDANSPGLSRMNLASKSQTSFRSNRNMNNQQQDNNNNPQAENFIKHLKQRNQGHPVAQIQVNNNNGSGINNPYQLSSFESKIPRATPTDSQRKVIKLKRSPNNRPPRVKIGSKAQSMIQTGDLLDLGSRQPESVKMQLEGVFGKPAIDADHQKSPHSQTVRDKTDKDDAFQTAKRSSVIQPDEVAQDEIPQSSAGGAVAQPGQLPQSMFTVPASDSNYQYDGTRGSQGLQKMTSGMMGPEIDLLSPIRDSQQNEKYQGNPLDDLQNQRPSKILNRNDSDEIVLNNDDDMEQFFQEQIPKRDVQDIKQSQEELESQILKIRDHERKIEAQKAEEMRQSMHLEKLKIEQKSKVEIDQKQRELDDTQVKLRGMSEASVQLQAQLQELKTQAAIFDEQKKRAREYMLRQQQENESLRQQNELLMKQKEQLEQTQQSERSQPASSMMHRASESATKTQTQQASDILSQQFMKTQDYFRINIQDIMFEKQIGAGASADVFKATYKENDVAVKKLKFANNGQDTGKNNLTKEFKREIATLIKVRHTNLVNFMGACTDDSRGHVLILTEFCFGGTLFSLLHEKKMVELTMKQRFRMAIDIAKGMNFLHIQEPQILHRDLKSLNLLLVEDVKSSSDYVQVKVTDFGLSRSKEEMNSVTPGGADAVRMTGLAGTFHWMAPEVLQSDTNYTHKADIYSFGIVMWEIMAREPPFKSLRPHEIMSAVVNQQTRPDMSKLPANCPNQYKLILERCWHQNPEMRPDFSVIVKMMRKIESAFQ